MTAGKADPDYVGDAPIDTEDDLADVMARKAGIGAISFIAFTATPKGKTVELFCR